MDLEFLLKANRRSLIRPGPSMRLREQRAYVQFAVQYAEQTQMTRDALLGSAK
jgi:hypothetical protein